MEEGLFDYDYDHPKNKGTTKNIGFGGEVSPPDLIDGTDVLKYTLGRTGPV